MLGRFADMLLAVEGHPAMLIYLDNARSIGPMSVAGINRDRGLNENLAREILELHTLGVRSVYTQDDVTNFAKVLTGWTVIPIASDPERGGEFIFNKRMHEPGPLKVVGKTYDDTGVEQGRAVLRDLARHAATAKHVAEKLARHFVADQPPPALVERLTKSFLDTEGDLKEVAKALVSAPEAWAASPGKLKRPGEWMIAFLRATGVPPNIQRILGGQNLLGEPLWRPPAPKGFPDDDAAWVDGLAQRLEMATQFAQRVVERVDVDHIVETALGPLASAETRQTVARAESRAQALALLLMAPEFQRGDASWRKNRSSTAPSRRDRMRWLLLPPARLLSPGPMSPSSRARKAAIRACSSSCCAARSTGLRAVAPVGDPDWVKLRGDKALVLDGKTPALPLDSFFALNPAMPNLHRLYKAEQATIIVHAAATPYRERSHFDGQDVLESGLPRPGAVDSGWLNRALAALEPAGRVRAGRQAFAVGPLTPLVVRGPAPVLSWTPPRLPPASDDTLMRLLDLYRHTDPALARALEERMGLAAIARAGGMDQPPAPGNQPRPAGTAQVRAYFAEAAGTAAKFLARADGPRIGALAFDGWDTHVNEGARPAGGSRTCSARSTARSRRSRPTWARPGARPWSRSSPSSAAPRASTAPTAPTTAPRPWRCSPAAR